MKLHIETVTGYTFEVSGKNYRHEDGVHYLAGNSYPDEIVKKVEEDDVQSR